MLEKLVDALDNGVNKIVVKRVSEEREGKYGKFKGMIVVYNGEEYNQLLKQKDYHLGVAGNTLMAIKNLGPKGNTVFLTECTPEDEKIVPKIDSTPKDNKTYQTQTITSANGNNKDIQIASLAIFKSVYDRSKSIEECMDESIKGARYLISKLQ